MKQEEMIKTGFQLVTHGVGAFCTYAVAYINWVDASTGGISKILGIMNASPVEAYAGAVTAFLFGTAMVVMAGNAFVKLWKGNKR